MTDKRRPRDRCPTCGIKAPVDHDPRALREARIRAGLRQNDLAKKLSISQSVISEAENGTRALRPELRDQLAKFLNCDRDTFAELPVPA